MQALASTTPDVVAVGSSDLYRSSYAFFFVPGVHSAILVTLLFAERRL
jgi:hypothetical protein